VGKVFGKVHALMALGDESLEMLRPAEGGRQAFVPDYETDSG
jgi:hypothetical protein